MTTTTEGPASSRSLRRNPDYLLLWGGGSLSVVGSSMSRIAFPLLVLEITRSAASAGLVGALAALPYPILGLPAGALADRWNRRRAMIACDVGRAAALGSVPLALWAGRVSLLQLCIVAAIEGSLFTFYDAAWNAAVPRVVSARSLPSALALNQGTLGMAGIVGPPLGGVLYGMARSFPFLADAVSYLMSMVSLLVIRAPLQGERVSRPTHLWQEVVDGLRWSWERPAVLLLGIAAAINDLVFAGLSLTIIVVARHAGASAPAIGLMFAIAAVGGTAGSFLTGPLMARFPLRALMTGLVCGEVALGPLFLLTVSPIVLGVLTGLLWLFRNPFNLVQSTRRRQILPDEYQGRVNTLFELLKQGTDAIAFALTGILLATVGSRPLIILLFASLGLLAVLLVTTLKSTASGVIRDPIEMR